MKRLLKSFGLIVLLFCLTFLEDVNAASVTVGGYTANDPYNGSATTGTKSSSKYSLDSVPSKAVLNTPGGARSNLQYYLHNLNGKEIYCMDAALASTNKGLYAGRILFYEQGSLEKAAIDSWTYMYDISLMTALISGGYADYFQHSLAVRTVSAAWGALQWSTNSDDKIQNSAANNYSRDQMSAFYGTAYKWIQEDSEIQEYIDTINKALPSAKVGSQLSGYSGYYWTGNLDGAKAAFKAALKASADHASKLGGKSNIKFGTPIPDSKVEETEDSNGTLVKKQIEFKATVEEFKQQDDNPAIFKIDSIAFDGGYSIYGALKEPQLSYVSIAGNTICEGAEICAAFVGRNLLEGLDLPEKFEIVIKVQVEGYSKVNNSGTPMLNCGKQPMPYTIKYSYGGGGFNSTGTKSELENNIAIVWRNQSDAKDMQRFVSYEGKHTPDGSGDDENNDELTPGELKGEVSLVEDCDCDELAEACIATNDKNSDPCQQFFDAGCDECDELEVLCELGDQAACDQYDKECKKIPEDALCPTGKTEITECCDEAGDLLIIDGTNGSGLMDDPYEIHGNKVEDIKLCFVDYIEDNKDPIDEKNNKYQMLTDDRVVGNPYCKVNCREDYAITFPTAKRVNAGRYFTFQAKMESHKQCFTSKIDREQYIEDMVNYLKAIEQAYNTYQEYYRAWELSVPNPSIQIPTGCQNGTADTCATITDIAIPVQDGGSAGVSGNYTYVGLRFDIDEERGELKSPPTPENRNATHTLHTIWGPATVCTGQSCYIDKFGNKHCSPCDVAVYPNYEEKTEQDFKDEMEKVYTQAKSDYESAIQGLKEAIKNFKGCSEWETDYKPDPEVKYDYEEDYRSMAGMPIDMDGSYDVEETTYSYCSQEWTNDVTVDVDKTYESCKGGSGFSSDTKESLLYIESCSLNGYNGGCVSYKDNMSKAIFKKSNADAAGEYKPQSIFWNIYPDGNIITNGNTSNGVLLEESLPVALDTRKGVHEYNVVVNNIGEFYKDGTQGRFVGSNGIIDTEINYVCSYLVNIPDAVMTCDSNGCEGPNCTNDCVGPNCDDFECEGENCVSDCVSSGCMYDKDSGLTYYEKEVTLGNLFPQGTAASNWDSSQSSKAAATIKEIESGDGSLDNPGGNAIFDQEPILSITFTPSISQAILKYNEDAESDGGYSNKTVYCKDVGGYEKVGCYSEFMDDFIDGNINGVSTADSINSKSLIGKDRSYRSSVDKYFQLWGAISDKIGPSWK